MEGRGGGGGGRDPSDMIKAFHKSLGPVHIDMLVAQAAAYFTLHAALRHL